VPGLSSHAVVEGGDRRRTPRLRAGILADCCPLFHRGKLLEVSRTQRVVVRDLSATGIFVTDVCYLAVGTTVQLYLRLPDLPASVISCVARVVRCQRNGTRGLGLRLLRLRTADVPRLERFMRYLKVRHTGGPLMASGTVELRDEDLLPLGPPPILPGVTIELSERDLESAA